MSDSFRTTPPEQQWSGSNTSSNGYQSTPGSNSSNNDSDGEGEVGKALLVGLLGGIVSAAGYFVYRRLPDEQRERLHAQVRSQVQQKINDLRSNFNI